MTESLRDRLISKGWVTDFNANNLVNCVEDWLSETKETNQQESINDKTYHITKACDSPHNHLIDSICITALIAALKAVVDEVIPEYRPNHPHTLDEQYRMVSVFNVRQRFQSIINQLKNK